MKWSDLEGGLLALRLSFRHRLYISLGLGVAQTAQLSLGIAIITHAVFLLRHTFLALPVFGGPTRAVLPLLTAAVAGGFAGVAAMLELWRSRDVSAPRRTHGATLRLTSFYASRGGIATVLGSALAAVLVHQDLDGLRRIVPHHIHHLFSSYSANQDVAATEPVNHLQQYWECCGLAERRLNETENLASPELFWTRHGYSLTLFGRRVGGSVPWSCCRRGGGGACYHLGFADSRWGPAWAYTLEERASYKKASIYSGSCDDALLSWLDHHWYVLAAVLAFQALLGLVTAVGAQYVMSAERDAAWGSNLDVLGPGTGFLCMIQPLKVVPPLYRLIYDTNAIKGLNLGSYMGARGRAEAKVRSAVFRRTQYSPDPTTTPNPTTTPTTQSPFTTP